MKKITVGDRVKVVEVSEEVGDAVIGKEAIVMSIHIGYDFPYELEFLDGKDYGAELFLREEIELVADDEEEYIVVEDSVEDKLLEFTEIEYPDCGEEATALVDSNGKRIMYGDYYHDKITQRIEGFFEALDFLGIKYTLEHQEKEEVDMYDDFDQEGYVK